MTPLPDRGRENSRSRVRKCGVTSVARPLHGSRALRMLPLLLLVGGCVIPPSLSVDNSDAGVNSPPSIVSARADGVDLGIEPQIQTFSLGQQAQLSLTLLDTDINDTLYVRVFVGYNDPILGEGANPTPPRSTCIAAAAKTAQRNASCDLTGLCETQDVGQTRSMRIVVFDRQPMDSGTPMYQAMPDGSGGQATSRFYYLKCQPPQT